MTPSTPPPDGRAVVAEKAKARRARTRRLRRRVAAGATAAFLALFAGISVQRATGNDPAMSTSKNVTASAPATTRATSSTSGTTTSSSSSTPSTVTSQQS